VDILLRTHILGGALLGLVLEVNDVFLDGEHLLDEVPLLVKLALGPLPLQLLTIELVLKGGVRLLYILQPAHHLHEVKVLVGPSLLLGEASCVEGVGVARELVADELLLLVVGEHLVAIAGEPMSRVRRELVTKQLAEIAHVLLPLHLLDQLELFRQEAGALRRVEFGFFA